MDNFVTSQLGVDKEQWKKVKIDEIEITVRKDKNRIDREILFVKFKEVETANWIRSHLKNTETDINSRVIQYTHRLALARYRFIDSLRYNINNKGQKAKILLGRYDYKLVIKERDDETKWGDIPPALIPDHFPEIIVGTLNEADQQYDRVEREERKEKMEIRRIKYNEYREREIVQRTEENRRLDRAIDDFDNEMFEYESSPRDNEEIRMQRQSTYKDSKAHNTK